MIVWKFLESSRSHFTSSFVDLAQHCNIQNIFSIVVSRSYSLCVFFNDFCYKWSRPSLPASRSSLSLSRLHLSSWFLDPFLPCSFQIIFSTVKNVLNFLDLFYHCLDLITDQALGLIYPRLFQIQLCAPGFEPASHLRL